MKRFHIAHLQRKDRKYGGPVAEEVPSSELVGGRGRGGGREASTKGVEVHAHLRKFEKSMF